MKLDMRLLCTSLQGNIWTSLKFYVINNVFLIDCGNIVEISMRNIDKVNAKRKLEIMDATKVFWFCVCKIEKKESSLMA